jgi:hypothetical protein
MSATSESSGSPILTVPVEIPDHLQKPVGTPGPRLLAIERAKASFSPRDLELYLYGKDYIERRDRILPVLENEVRPGRLYHPQRLQSAHTCVN